MNDYDENIIVPSPKKRKLGRSTEVAKKLKLSSHETGDDCKCKRLQCFSILSELDRIKIISIFNSLDNRNEQNSYLASLISIVPVKKRRSRSNNPENSVHDCSFQYKIKVHRGSMITEVPVCCKAFKSLHGITNSKLEYIQASLKSNIAFPKDQRGKHTNRPHKIPIEVKEAILSHIKSLEVNKKRHSKKKTNKVYLPAELNINKTFALFKEENECYKEGIAYDTYRRILKTFNVSFIPGPVKPLGKFVQENSENQTERKQVTPPNMDKQIDIVQGNTYNHVWEHF